MKDSMTRCYELPNLGGSFQQAHADRPERPGRQIDGILSIGALQLVNGPEPVVRRSVGGVCRWRQRRTAIRGLQDINDHHLKNIGLSRCRIVSRAVEIIEAGSQPA